MTKDRSRKNSKPARTVADGKGQALELAITQIERQFGKGSIMRLGDSSARLETAMLPTGSLSLDIALGVGGLPLGRIIEMYGPESGGKTSLALSVAAQAQRTGGIAAFIDVEHALDPVYARKLGVDIDNLLVAQPNTAEEALEICEALVRSGAVKAVVLDSVAALVPRAEIEGDMGDAQVGAQARLMSQALRKLTGSISKSGTCAIFINQLREKIGIMFGNPETTPGGRALKFYSSVRMEIRKGEKIEQAGKMIGTRIRVKIVKNKVAPPFRTSEVELMFESGISKAAGIIDAGIEQNILTRSGSWLSWGDERLGQGRDRAREYMESKPELLEKLEKAVLAEALPHLISEKPEENKEKTENGETAKQ